jgi:RNA-directed DNA polymerase
MSEIPSSNSISTKQSQIAKLARQMPGKALTSLSQHIDLDWLKEAYRRTRKDGAVGVDGQTAADYEGELEANLMSLLNRAKSGTYRAPPVRRVYIPKGSGGAMRPIGIPTFEDKVLQRAVVMILGEIYEQDFLDCSFGFRPGRSQHMALESFWKQAMAMGGGTVVEVDVKSFFDVIDHSRLRKFLRQRVRDGVLLRLIGKWLKAGVLEEGRVSHPGAGAPQGGVISPLLANVFLHEVLDTWFEAEVLPRLRGRGFMVRFADDFVMCFEHEEDAQRVLAVVDKRFSKYGLTVHPDKTRLVSFRRPPRHDGGRGANGTQPPGSLNLLGFTHYWGRSRRGYWVIKRKTMSSRLSRSLRAVWLWCKANRHRLLADQHRQLVRKLQGHYAYYGITGNGPQICAFRHWVYVIWRKWLNRRSRHTRGGLAGLDRRLERYALPNAVVVHSVYRT